MKYTGALPGWRHPHTCAVCPKNMALLLPSPSARWEYPLAASFLPPSHGRAVRAGGGEGLKGAHGVRGWGMPESTLTHVARACDTEIPQLAKPVGGLNTTHSFFLFSTFKLVFPLPLLRRGFPMRGCLAGREKSRTKREGARSISQTAACRRDLPDKRSQAAASFICIVSGAGGAREGSLAC